MNLRFVFLLTSFLLLSCIQVFSQYYPFYAEQRTLKSYFFFADYEKILEEYNHNNDIPRAIHALDSLSNLVLKKEEYRGWLFLQNEKSNFLKFDNQIEEAHAVAYQAMQTFAENRDTLTLEYAVSLRLLRGYERLGNIGKRTEKELFNSQMALIKKLGIKGEPLTNTLVEYGLFLLRDQKKEKAIDLLYEARKSALKNDDLKSLALADYSIITNIDRIDLQQTTLDIIHTDIELFEENLQSIPVLIYNSYFHYLAGETYYKYFNKPDTAIRHYKTAIACLDTLAYPQWNLRASIHSSLAKINAVKKNETDFRYHYQKAFAIASDKPMSSYNQALSYYNLQSAMLNFYPDSVLLNHKNHQLLKGYPLFKYNFLSNVVKANIKLKNYEKALTIINENSPKTISIGQTTFPSATDSLDKDEQISMLSLAFEAISQLYSQNGSKDYEQAIVTIIKEQNNLYIEWVEENIFSHELSSITNDYHDFIMKSLHFYHHNKLEESYPSQIAKLIISSKALELNNNLGKNKIQTLIEEDTELLQSLMTNTTEIQKIRNEKNNQHLEEEKQKHLNKELNTLLIENLMLRQRINEEKLNHIHSVKIPSLAEIQESLAPGEVILEYCITDTMIVRAGIGKDFFNTRYIIREDIDKLFNNAIYEVKTGNYFSEEFSTILLEGLEKELLLAKKIIVVPDKKMNQIPFELLIWGDGLIIDFFPVVYNYSSSLWYRQKSQKREEKEHSFLAVAPVFDPIKNNTENKQLMASTYREIINFSPLKYSAEEVKTIHNLFSDNGLQSKTLTYNESTEDNVRKKINQYSILHFATHGIVDKENSERSGLVLFPDEADPELSLSGEDNFLSLGELFTIRLNAHLVTLSACNTGIGEIRGSEGVIALPRGFIHAGVPNVLASLWRVNDEKTKNLMTRFYYYVLKEKSFPQAIRLAKLDCINHGFLPLDWSGFILVGI